MILEIDYNEPPFVYDHNVSSALFSVAESILFYIENIERYCILKHIKIRSGSGEIHGEFNPRPGGWGVAPPL